jgi:hypothetical protein
MHRRTRHERICDVSWSLSPATGPQNLLALLKATRQRHVPTGVLPVVSTPVQGLLDVGLKPGLVIVVPVVKEEFKGPDPWVMISNFHVKIDGCVGQSFIRSFATLTRQTDQSDVVVSYMGVTKAV